MSFLMHSFFLQLDQIFVIYLILIFYDLCRYLLSDLLEPLVRLCVDQTETETEEEALEIEKSREIVVSEFELDLCIKRLHLCFVSVNDPSMIFISHLQPVFFF
jgi:hypothetical protein